MESLRFEFAGTRRATPFESVLVGVVGSGNLEVLLETAGDAPTRTRFVVETSARGFNAIWEAVLRDFHERRGFGGLSFSINDMGATPAVVGLRLEQAAAALVEAT